MLVTLSEDILGFIRENPSGNRNTKEYQKQAESFEASQEKYFTPEKIRDYKIDYSIMPKTSQYRFGMCDRFPPKGEM